MIKKLILIALLGACNMQAASSSTTTTAATTARTVAVARRAAPAMRFAYHNASLKEICLHAIAQRLAIRQVEPFSRETGASASFEGAIEQINGRLNNELLDELYVYSAIKIMLSRQLLPEQKRIRLQALVLHLEATIQDPNKAHCALQYQQAINFITSLLEKVLPTIATPNLETVVNDTCAHCNGSERRKLMDFAVHAGSAPAYRAFRLLGSPEPTRSDNPLVIHDHFRLLDLVLEEAPSLNCINLFFAAARDGNITAMEMLLEHPTRGVDIDALNNTGSTALMIALSNRHEDAALWLMRRGANIKIRNAAHEQAIHIACFYGLTQAASQLLESGARINTRDKFLQTPLHKACSNHQLECAQLLLAHNASLTARDKQGDTPLHCAIGSLELLQALLEAGADINAQAKDYNTVLHCALLADRKRIDIIKFLIKRGAFMNIQNQDYQTATALIARYATLRNDFRIFADELGINYVLPAAHRENKRCQLM